MTGYHETSYFKQKDWQKNNSILTKLLSSCLQTLYIFCTTRGTEFEPAQCQLSLFNDALSPFCQNSTHSKL